MNRNRNELYRFRGDTPPTEASRASILEPAIEGTVAELCLYDPIDSWGGWWGVSAKEFAAALAELPDDTSEIRLHINSPGGDVWDAMAMVNQLRRHDARVVAVVDGIAASAASVIAATADECVMGVGAQLMIHDAWNVAIGDESDMLNMAARLSKDSNSVAAIYAGKAGGTTEDWRALMRAETWYTAAEAVEAGLADRTTEDPAPEASANALVDLSLFRYAGRNHAPAPAAAMAAPKPPSSTEPVETNPQKGVTMSDISLKSGLHTRLGIKTPIDELTDEQMLAAVDEVLSEQADEAPSASVPDGTVLVDQTQYEQMRADAAAGREAREQQIAANRDQMVDDAVKDGRIAPANRDAFRKMLDTDEARGAEVINQLQPNAVPVAEIGHAGGTEAESGPYSQLYTKKEN